MRDFLFAPEQARTPVGVLSGGERGRLMLARALAKPSNVLVLDEPTNDLDLETLDVLEEMLGDYAGTVVLISHDRDFLDRAVNGVIAPEGNGRWVEYAGGYSDMLAQGGEDLARVALKPADRKRQERKSGEGGGAQPRSAAARFHGSRARDPAKTIVALTARMRALHERLDDPGLYGHDRKAFEEALRGARRHSGGAGQRGREMAGAGNAARRDRRGMTKTARNSRNRSCRCYLPSVTWFDAPQLKAGEFDGLFNAGAGQPVRRVLIGPERAYGTPRAVVLRQFASRRVTRKCVQIGVGFRYEHVDLH